MGEVDPKLGELIKRKRLERKLTQEQTAELVGCNTQYYKNLENGCGMPSVPMFCRIMRHSTFPPMITYTLIKTAAFLFISLCFIF